MEAIKNAIRNELKCRKSGSLVSIETLVQDYGMQVKKALMQMHSDDECMLIGCSTFDEFESIDNLIDIGYGVYYGMVLVN